MADVEIDDNDRPVIAFSVQKDGRGLPQGSGGFDHRYHLARPGPDGWRHYEIFEGKSTDGGKTFAWQALTKNSTVDNIRPIIPAWTGDQRVVLWMRGSYTTYTDFDTQIVGVLQDR